MTIAVLRPNALVASNEASVTGGTAEAVTADNNDATYLNFPDSGYLKMYRLGFGTVSIPDNAIVRSVTPRVRHDSTTVPDLTRTLQLLTGSKQFPIETLNYHGTTVTQTGFARSNAPDGRIWTQQNIDALELEVRFQLTPTYRPSFLVHALYIDVEYNEAPVAVGAGPNAIVETTKPRFSWTYTDPEGDAQERFIVDVFSDSQIGDPLFDPYYSTPIVTSGEVYSSANYWDCPVALENNHTYRAYVRVADRGSDGRYSLMSISGPYAWAEVHIVELSAPLLVVAAPATPDAAVELTITGRDNELTADSSDFETTVGEWETTGTNCTAVRLGGQATAESGSSVLKITATAIGDCELSMVQDADAFKYKDEGTVDAGDVYGALFVRNATGSPVQFQVLMHFLLDDGTFAETIESGLVFTDSVNIGNFISGQSIYDDATRVVLGVRILGATASQEFHVDAISLSPTYINQVKNPAFHIDTDADGVADDWTIVNTGGDPAPTVDLDRNKVFGGVQSQHIRWEDNGGIKGIEQRIDIPAFACKLIQVWVAVEMEGNNEAIIEVRHGGLPWASVLGNVLIPCDGEFYPITMQLTDTSGSNTGENFRVVTQQGGITGPVDLWIGCVAMVDGDPSITPTFGAGPWQGDVTYGIFNLGLTSGPFSHGGVIGSQHFELQRSLDDGATWLAMTRVGTNPDDWQVSDLSDVDPSAMQQLVDAFDFEAPPQTMRYRARSVASLPSADVLVSNWSEWVSVVVPAGGWWLKSLTDPGQSVKLYVHNQTLKWSSTSRESINYALGRKLPIIMTDAISGDTAPLQLSFIDEESYDAFEALRETATTFLLQSSYGDHRYVRLIVGRDEEFMLNGGRTRKRIVSVTVAEVGEP